ncbi:hypothetical protein X474_02525 [Dethiosulfatarculus sandiegensis]|uniref:Uncharacterized protein n=1 Tax=Dethiosulfatarculus sandiegensis TaxID=1429043 RepID=A0A0D2JJ45_9BACT|nr:hypothetical protein X474_02525 [Dethiosulfatarculus sandiegensis]
MGRQAFSRQPDGQLKGVKATDKRGFCHDPLLI